MTIKALKFIVKDDQLASQPVTINLASELYSELTEGHQPSVYLVKSKDLEFFRQAHQSKVIIDRGRKDERKGFSAYLLNKQEGKIPMIDSDFDEKSKQVERSLRDFLCKAVKNEEARPFIIGVNEANFNRFHEDPSKNSSSGDFYSTGPSIISTFHDEKKLQIIELLKKNRLTDPKDEKYLNELRDEFFGDSPDFELIRISILQAAKSKVPVLILGESGTGKDKVARLIHKYSQKYGIIKKKMNTLNCAAIPTELLESELFGIRKGAAYGITEDRIGVWEASNDGTFFLDEIAELRSEHQAKILRSLDKNVIRWIGDTKETPVNARIIAATNKNLSLMAHSGLFREDLYYRLRGIQIITIPLRKHPEVIPEFAQLLWNRILTNAFTSTAHHQENTDSPEVEQQTNYLSKDTLAALQSKPWPGNVRDLSMQLKQLYAWWGKDDLTVEKLEALFYLEEQVWALDRDDMSESTAYRHNLDCLIHLNRSIETIRDCRGKLVLLFPENALDHRNIKRWNEDMELSRKELEDLCGQPSLFFEDSLFQEVWQLIGRLNIFQDRMKRSDFPDYPSLKKELEAAFDQVIAQLDAMIHELKREV